MVREDYQVRSRSWNPPGKTLKVTPTANEAINDVWEVEPVENDELVEPELVEESENKPEVTSSSRNRGVHNTFRQSIKPPEDTYTHEGYSGQAFIRRAVM